MTLTAATGRHHFLVALFLLIAMTATVGTALGFQHIGGFIPCKLCLEQRDPYYIAIPIMLLAVVSAGFRWSGTVTRGLLVAGGLLMTYGLVLAVYHSGVEWAWWPGPTDCGAAVSAVTQDAGNLLSALDDTRPPSCDQAAGRFLGLSFAGWNAIASAFLAAIAFRGALAR